MRLRREQHLTFVPSPAHVLNSRSLLSSSFISPRRRICAFISTSSINSASYSSTSVFSIPICLNNSESPTDEKTDDEPQPDLPKNLTITEDESVVKQEPSTATNPLIQSMLSALKRCFQPPAFLVGLLTGVTLTVFLFFIPGPGGNRDVLVRQKVTLFDVILHDINDSYVEQVDINRLFETGVNSMLGTLDPYTQFENNAQALEMSVKTNGRYAGVGLGLALGDPSETPTPSIPVSTSSSSSSSSSATSKAAVRPIIVVSAFEGYAFDAGVRPGDVIECVEGVSVKENSLEKVTEILRGEPGTKVNISVRRQGFEKTLPFTLFRKSVQIKDVPAFTFIGDKDDGIAYIRLQSFAKDAAAEVSSAINTLTSLSEKQSINSIILDLRGNPGGLLNAAIEVCEMLVPRNSTIVSTRGRGLGPSPSYISSKDPLMKSNTKLAVLVNGQTASASEIVAGAIQDLDLGIVVGSRTFGKGLVQNVQELPFNTALKYTVGKYYTPSGRCIQSLNYTQGEMESSQFVSKQVEENQRKEYKTSGGRTVRDGGGIEPDIEISKNTSFLDIALLRQNMYFRFATRFGADVKLEHLPDDFKVTNDVYKDFIKFIGDVGFKYESRFDEAFDTLDVMLKDVGYDGARVKIGELRKVTNTEMKSDFLRHEHDIKSQLESAIRFRFQPDSERILADLRNDEQVNETIGILKNGKLYKDLLTKKVNI